MSWLTPASAASALESALAHRPELLALYRRFYTSFWEDVLVPRRTLELCRLRIAAIHDCAAEWLVRDAAVDLDTGILAALRQGRVDTLGADDRTALAIAENMPFAHHQVSDADVAAACAAFGEAGCVSLLTALAFFDVSCRLRLVLGVAAEPASLDPPPLNAAGALN